MPYVNDLKKTETSSFVPTIYGYRDSKGTWYNDKGVEVSSPDEIVGVSGQPIPYRTARGQKTADDATLHVDGVFERYKPQIVAMPRIAFSFPIGEKSQFKASYDIIARRPSGGWSADYLTYLYMTQNNSVTNPNLKPERITNYELGFQQALNQSSAISASTSSKCISSSCFSAMGISSVMVKVVPFPTSL